MIGEIRVVRSSEAGAVEALAKDLRAWEPRLDLTVAREAGRLYECDGTLYAVCLSAETVLSYDRRHVRPLRRGDAVVVPGGVAVDVAPDADFLFLWHGGPRPAHFRERFVQVWGFEHVPLADPPAPGGWSDVLSASDGRYRVSYATTDLPDARPEPVAAGMDVILVLGLGGAATVESSGWQTPIDLGPDLLVAIGPAARGCLRGPGRVGLLSLEAELVHEARIAGVGRGPEVGPGADPREAPAGERREG